MGFTDKARTSRVDLFHWDEGLVLDEEHCGRRWRDLSSALDNGTDSIEAFRWRHSAEFRRISPTGFPRLVAGSSDTAVVLRNCSDLYLKTVTSGWRSHKAMAQLHTIIVSAAELLERAVSRRALMPRRNEAHGPPSTRGGSAHHHRPRPVQVIVALQRKEVHERALCYFCCHLN